MIWLYLVPALIAVIALVWAIYIRQRFKFLATPHMGEIPLPSIHDSRWKRIGSEYYCGPFTVDADYDLTYVRLDGMKIGNSFWYTRAVRAQMRQSERVALRIRAIETCDDVQEKKEK